MIQKTSKQQAQALLDQLKELDRLVHRAYYEMGRLLFVLRDHKLWEVLGYASWSNMVEEELSCSVSTAVIYSDTYKHLKRLRYSKEESIKFIETIGLRTLHKVLPSQKEKLSITQLRHRKEKLNRCVSFWISPDQEAFLEEVLMHYGLVIKNNRWENASEAFFALVEARRNAA